MVKILEHEYIFSLFLKAIHFDAQIVSRVDQLKARRKNVQIILIKSTKRIILTEYGTRFNGFEYEKTKKVFLYKIVETDGAIKIVDANERIVLHLFSDHDIVKVGSIKTFKQVKFEGKAELLQYQNQTQNVQNTELSLFDFAS